MKQKDEKFKKVNNKIYGGVKQEYGVNVVALLINSGNNSSEPNKKLES